jgi:hypothetical protein
MQGDRESVSFWSRITAADIPYCAYCAVCMHVCRIPILRIGLCLPYSGEQTSSASSPTFIVLTPSSHPLITWPNHRKNQSTKKCSSVPRKNFRPLVHDIDQCVLHCHIGPLFLIRGGATKEWIPIGLTNAKLKVEGRVTIA